MAQYIAKGRLELWNVDYFIEADSLEEAKRKAREGEYDFYELYTSETLDVDIYPISVKPNE